MDDPREKVRKLMAIASDERANEFEAEAAMRQAEKLMRKHGIEAAELQARTGTKPVYTWATKHVPAGAPQPIRSAPMWFGTLATAIAKFTDCKAEYSRPENGRYGICIKYSGDAIDVEFAVYLTKHLRDDCRRQSGMFPGDRGEKESFRKGYAARIYERMAAMMQERRAALEAVQTSAGTALVVVNQKLALRDAEFGAQTWGKARSYSYRSSGYSSGREAGNRAGLGRPVAGTSQRSLLK